MFVLMNTNEYTDVPNWLFSRHDLTAQEKWAYVCLLSYARRAQAVEASEFGIQQPVFAQHTRLTTKQAEAILASLKAKGLIRSYSAFETIDYDSYWMIQLPYPEEDGREEDE